MSRHVDQQPLLELHVTNKSSAAQLDYVPDHLSPAIFEIFAT
jgi:hypothetical protein